MPALAPQKREAIRVGLASGVPRKAIARDINVSVTTVFKYGAGITPPRFVPASKVCVVCGDKFYPSSPTQAPGRWKRRIACSVKCGCKLAWSRS